MMEATGAPQMEQDFKTIKLPEGCEDATAIPGFNKETDPPLQRFDFTDLGNARRFEWRYEGKFIYTKATKWLVYENGRWHIDKTKQAEQAMLRTLNLIVQEADLVEGDDEAAKEAKLAIYAWAKACEALALFNNAMKFSETLSSFVRDYAIFDNRPDLFLCANGTLNLETGKFGPFDPRHLLTKGSNVKYDPSAKAPQWEKFLIEVMGGKEHMVRYLARASGYTLTADTGGQCLFVPHGTGGTGKSTFLNVMQGIMGDYCQSADPEMFMAKRGDSGQPFEMAGLEGVRALFAVETEDNKELACAKVKRMTGQDPVRACHKFCDHYEFVPTYKIWLATNDKPKMNATDDAMWDRPKLVPFDVRFRGEVSEVKNLAQKLLAEEASGILNWMVRGHAEWKAGGLQHPDEVVYAVKEWRGDEDYLGRFLAERTLKTANPPEYVSKSDLFAAFNRWTETAKEGEGLRDKRFTDMMRRKGFTDKIVRQSGKATRVWLELKAASSYSGASLGGFEQVPCDPDLLH
jgi:putative DNA primase/helicase